MSDDIFNFGCLVGMIVGCTVATVFGPQHGWHSWIWYFSAEIGAGWLFGSLDAIRARLSSEGDSE